MEYTPESPIDPYRTINVLHAARWVVDAWKHGFTASTLVHCFQHSQVKVYGPPMLDPNDLDGDIYECIRVAHPGFQRASLSEFIDSIYEVVENSAEEEEQRILDTYEPAALHESDSEADECTHYFLYCSTWLL